MMLIRGDELDPEEEDLGSSNWIEEMAMGGHHRSTRPNTGSTEFMEQRQLHRRQMLGIFILLGILWGLFIGSSNGYEGGSIFFRVGNNGFPSSSNDDSTSKSHGPLPTNGMSPTTQQWFKAAKQPKKNKHITGSSASSTTATMNLVGDSSSTTSHGTDVDDASNGDGASISPCSKTSINVVVMDPKSLQKGMEQHLFDMIIDVRTSAEWRDTGHLPNATLVENLADESDIETIIERMGGIKCITNPTTNIVVYCTTGKRASKAITKLIEAGFCGSALINGQGIQQWTDAGMELVHTNSAIHKCWEETLDEEQEEERNDKNDQDHI